MDIVTDFALNSNTLSFRDYRPTYTWEGLAASGRVMLPAHRGSPRLRDGFAERKRGSQSPRAATGWPLSSRRWHRSLGSLFS